MKRFYLIFIVLLMTHSPGWADENEVSFTPPVLRNQVEAEYPPKALEELKEAEVVMELDIDANGVVEGVFVTEPAAEEGYGFEDAAVSAAYRFEFEPALENGEAVPVRITYAYRFVLSDKTTDTDTDTPVEQTYRSKEEGEGGESTDSSDLREPTVSLRGKLKERGTRLPIVGVTLIVFFSSGENDDGFEVITDSDGQFTFYDLEPGTWRIWAEPDGYFPLKTSEQINPSEVTEVTYLLEKATYNPYDVLVEGERVRKEVNRTTVMAKQADKVPGTFGDVLAVVRNLPGVARTGPVGGGSNLIVRGSSPEDSRIFVNGVNVPIIYHFGGLRSVIPVGMLDKLDFYPGNFSAEYGRATGGVVDVGLKDLSPERIGGYLDINIADTGVYLEAPIGDKVALAIGGRRSYLDGILNLAIPKDAPVNLLTAPRYYDYQFLGKIRPNADHDINLFVFGSDDKLEVLFDNPANFSPELRANDATTSTTFYRTLIEYNFTPSDNIANELKLSSGRNWVYFGIGDQVYADFNTYVAEVRDTLRVSLSEAFSFSVGLDYLFERNDVRLKFPETSKEGEARGRPDFDTIRFTTEKDSDQHNIGAFLEAEISFLDRLSLVPGIRFDHFSRIEAYSIDPRLAMSYRISEQWLLKGGIGLFHKAPSFDETNEEFGNPNLELESAVHYSAGLEFRPLPYLTLDLTGFYKDLNNLVSRDTGTDTSDGELVPLRFNNEGEGRVFGMEILIRHDFANNFSGWLSYTLSRAERKDAGADEYRLFDYDQTHILSLLGTYELPDNWSISARWRLVSGSPTTPRVGSVYAVDDGLYEPIPGEPNSVRLPMFHQLDLRVDKRFVFDNWILTAYLDIQNVYNRANPVGISYNYDSSESRPRSSLPILPIIGLRGEF